MQGEGFYEMRLNYVGFGCSKNSDGRMTYTQGILTEAEFLQSLSDEKRQQIQEFNAQQSLVRDPDQTELVILAYQLSTGQTKNDKIMLVYIRDKTASYDTNSNAYILSKSRYVDIMLPYFIDRVWNIADMYGLVCDTLKLQSVTPVALTPLNNFRYIEYILKHDVCGHNWRRILDLRDLIIDQTSESQMAFRGLDNEQLHQRCLIRFYNNIPPALVFAPQTLGNIRAGQFEGETLLIWDSNGEDYVDDDSMASEVSELLYCKDEAVIVVPQKINLSSSENIDRLFKSQIIAPLIRKPDHGQSQDPDQHPDRHELDLVDFLSLGENVKTMKELFSYSSFKSIYNSGEHHTTELGYKTTLFIDVDKLKNLESMDRLCKESKGLNNIDIINLRPGISMKEVLADSEVSSIRLTGSVNAGDIASLFEKSCKICRIDLSKLTINTSTDPEVLKKQMALIFWRIVTKHTNLVINSDTYNKYPQLFKTIKRERKLNIKITD